MFIFTVKENDLKSLQDGEKVNIKINGQAAQVWIGQSPSEIHYQVGDDGPVQNRQVVDVGQGDDLVTFMCIQADQSLTIIRPTVEIATTEEELTQLRCNKVLLVAMVIGGLMLPSRAKQKPVNRALDRLQGYLESQQLDPDVLYHRLSDILDAPDQQTLDTACVRILDEFSALLTESFSD